MRKDRNKPLTYVHDQSQLVGKDHTPDELFETIVSDPIFHEHIEKERSRFIAMLQAPAKILREKLYVSNAYT